MEKVYIIGHKYPDTDSVCGAISLSYLKNRLGLNTEPRVLGIINPETNFALNYFHIDAPRYLNDVKVQLRDVNFNKNYVINENKPIIDAFKYMNDNAITGMALVDDDKKLKGYVSLKEIASDMIYNENLRIETSFDNLVEILEASSFIKFDDYIDGYAHAATFDDEAFIKNQKIDEQTILIVGYRESIIRHAIASHVKLIILVKDNKLTKEMRKEIEKNHINVISTPKSSFKIARVLCLANPVKSIKRGNDPITFNTTDYLSDFEEATAKLKHTNYPIINDKNVCVGMLRTIDAHEINRKKVILVDHNMLGQSVDGLYEAEILEIIDHHNIGDINTSSPINFRNMSVGSVNTIIYYLFKENGIRIPKDIAGIMLSGIISDTLLLQSPTTTMKDKMVATELANTAKVDLHEYGIKLLESGVSIDGLSANEIIYKDCKTYKVGEETIAIAQVFTTDIKVFKPRFEEIIAELNRMQNNLGYRFSVLFITNFLTNNSYVLYADNSKKTLEIAYGIEDFEEGHMIKNVVSRKKQIVPNIMNVLDR